MMAHLRSLTPGASLTIVGGPEGEASEYYQALLEQMAGLDDIRLVGAQEDIQPLLAQFRIFVMVSERQGCPNASLEAMAMGLPVIANRNGGIAEQVEHGVNGFLVDTPAGNGDAGGGIAAHADPAAAIWRCRTEAGRIAVFDAIDGVALPGVAGGLSNAFFA